MKKLIALTILLGFTAQAENKVTWDLVEAIRQIEACPKRVHTQRCCSGDHGLARGQWQFWSIAWKDVNINYRAPRKATLYSYQFAWDEKVARVYAFDFLQLIRKRYIAKTKKEPSVNELWAIWNCGYGRFFDAFDGKFSKCPMKTKANALRVRLLLQQMPGIK